MESPCKIKGITYSLSLVVSTFFWRTLYKYISISSGTPCEFPFSYGGRLHDHCTTDGDPNGKEWCATQINHIHNVREWTHCNLRCRDIVSMMVVGKTGVGKSTLLNSLLCPARLTVSREDCHFKTADGIESETKNISNRVGPWLDDTEAPVIPLVKVFDTPGLGDTDSLTDASTLEGIIETINSEPVNSILLLLKATDRFSQDIQKQLRTLEYVLGSEQLWDHVITVFTYWGFSDSDIETTWTPRARLKSNAFLISHA